MDSKFEFTDKTQQSISAAFQLAKDYGNAQGIFLVEHLLLHTFLTYRITVHPAHIAFGLINEEASDAASGSQLSGGGASLFSSVIQRAGGDPVRLLQTTYKILC